MRMLHDKSLRSFGIGQRRQLKRQVAEGESIEPVNTRRNLYSSQNIKTNSRGSFEQAIIEQPERPSFDTTSQLHLYLLAGVLTIVNVALLYYYFMPVKPAEPVVHDA